MEKQASAYVSERLQLFVSICFIEDSPKHDAIVAGLFIASVVYLENKKKVGMTHQL